MPPEVQTISRGLWNRDAALPNTPLGPEVARHRRDDCRIGRPGRGIVHVDEQLHGTPVPTKNLIRTVCVTDRAVLGRRTITSVGMADVRSVEVDGRLASFGRSSGRRVSVHGLQAPAIRGCGQAACRW